MNVEVRIMVEVEADLEIPPGFVDFSLEIEKFYFGTNLREI